VRLGVWESAPVRSRTRKTGKAESALPAEMMFALGPPDDVLAITGARHGLFLFGF
jgi:hypothetical protein